MASDQPEQGAELTAEEAIARLRELIQRARQGDATALPMLRRHLDRSPALWTRTGSLALQVQMKLIDAICGRDLHMRECIVRQVNNMKGELAGDAPSPMAKLLTERIITAYLQVGLAEGLDVQHPETSPQWARIAMQRQAQAERQLRAAIDALAALRRAERPIHVEIMQQRTPSGAPIFSQSAHGEQPPMGNGHTAANGEARPVNRFNGMNGHHNRLGDVLTPSTPCPS